MAKQEWTVRVINPTPYRPGRRIGSVELPGLWVEQMRRLGYLREIKGYDGEHAKDPVTGELMDSQSQVLELYCPNATKHDTHGWADMNADRMRSFGINAVATPKWGG